MSVESKNVIATVLRTEAEAFERDIARTGPRRDYFGARQFDPREDWLGKLRRALSELSQVPAAIRKGEA